MAEMKNLTLSVEINGAPELGEALTKSVEKAISTFTEFSRLLNEIANQLKALAKEKITLLGVGFTIPSGENALRQLHEAIETLKGSFVLANENLIRSIADLIAGFSNLVKRISTSFPFLTEYYTVMLAVGVAISAVVVAIGGIISAVKALSLALSVGAGPIGLIILALTGVVTATILVIRYWDEISAFAGEVWGGVTNVINTVVTGIMGLFEWLVNGIRDLWNGLISYLEENVPFAGKIFDAIRSDAEDTRQKNEALFNSIRESQKNNQPAILGFQQPGQNLVPQQQVITQTNLQTNALNNQAVANREATKTTLKNSEEVKENGKAHEDAKGKVDEHSGALTNFGNSGRAAVNPIEQLNDGLRNQITELQNQIEAVGKSGDELLELEAKQKLAEGASADLVAKWKELEKALEVAKKQEEFIGSIEDLIEKTKEETETLGLTGEELREYKIRALEAKLSTEEFTEDGLKKAQEELANLREETEKLNTAELAKKFEDMQFSLLPESEQERIKLEETLAFLDDFAERRKDLEEEIADVRVRVVEDASEKIQELERKEYIERLKESGSFTDGLKAGFIEFVDNVENNGELMADFFANTLTEMSQNFSDLFYNVLTGRFDNLKDLAKQAFEAILRAFLDMVSAIATRQIVISIGGIFGLGKSSRSAGGGSGSPLDLAQQGIGVAGSGAGLFGAGGAFSTFGAGITGGLAAVPGASAAGATASSLTAGAVASTPTAVVPGFLATAGAAITIVGAALAVAGLAYTIIAPFLKKTPRLDIDFDSVKTEVGRRAALVEEFLDPEFFMENIGQVSVKRGGVGIGAGGSNQILELIRERIEETIEGIQDIIAKLPTDLFNQLNETLLNAEIDIDTVIAGERLLEFDAKGKKIGEKFQQFIEGELPAKFFAAIRESFFEPAFLALGVSAEGTEALIDKFMADMEAAGSREARAEVGAEFIATFGAFVDAFNIVSGNVNDSIGQTIQSVNNLSAKLGFDAVPSIDELRKTLGEMIENAEIDAETVQAYADLRNAIVSLMSEITSAITGLIGKINQLNTTIVSLGGSAVDTTGFLNTAATQLQDFLGANMGNLSLSEQEGFLDQLLGIANDMLAQEQAAFAEAQQAAREAAEKAAEAQRAAVQQRIDGLNAEKERIQDVYNERIEALNEELRIAEGFAQLTESIRRTLDSILYSPESVLTGVEQVNALQTNVAALQQELAGTTDPERQMEIAGQLEEAFKTLFGAAGDAFGVNSPEYVAIFDQVTGGLTGLAEMTESRARTVEEINAEIERLTAEQNSRLESIDAKIEAAQEQLSAIGTQEVEATFEASDRVKELFEYIRTEYMRILEERFAQLEEASVTGFATELEGLQAIAGTSEESLVTLKEQMAEAVTQTGQLTKIADFLGALNGYDGGSGGLKDFGRGTLAVLHGKEAVVTEAQVRAMKKHMALAAEMTGGLGGALGGALETFAESIEGTGPVGRLGRELVGAGRLTELADRIGTARITSMMEEFAGANAGAGAVGGLVERLAEKLGGEDGHISGLARRAALEEVKNEMSVAISVNVNGGSGATVSVKLHSDGVAAYRSAGTFSTSARIEGLVPGQLYDFLIESLNATGELKGLGVVADNSGSGYIAGGDSTAPGSWTHSLTGAAKFGGLRWTWTRHPDPDSDISHYEIEITTSAGGGTLLKKDTVKHINGDSSFAPGYEYLRQTGNLTSPLAGAARIRAVDHSGNASGWTSRVEATTDNIQQLDIGNGEIYASAVNRDDSPSVAQNTNCISRSITKRAGTKIRIELTMQIERTSGGGTTFYQNNLLRGASPLKSEFMYQIGIVTGARHTLTATWEDDISSAGTFNYVVFNPSPNGSNLAGHNAYMRLSEVRNQQ